MEVCPKCGKPIEREITVGGRVFSVPVQCDCDIEEPKQKKVKSCVPRKYQECNNVDVKEAIKYVEHFDELSKDGIGLLFYGVVGTGKTYTAAYIANQLVNQGKKVVFTSLQDLYNQYALDNYTYLQTMSELSSYDLVVLDDLGTQRNTPAMDELAYMTINTLYEKITPMIITTNTSIAELDERIVDRIKEVCVPVQFKGKSRRTNSEAIKKATELLK